MAINSGSTVGLPGGIRNPRRARRPFMIVLCIGELPRHDIINAAACRHADVLLVTGPVTTNMREALERTYQATPAPKWVVAVGDCARNGGVFAGSDAVRKGQPALAGALLPAHCDSAGSLLDPSN